MSHLHFQSCVWDLCSQKQSLFLLLSLFLSGLYLLSFTVFILQPVQAMQPSSQSVQYPAVSYPPQHLLPVSPTQQFSVVPKTFVFSFLEVGCVSMSMLKSIWGGLRGASPMRAPTKSLSALTFLGTDKHFIRMSPLVPAWPVKFGAGWST